MRTISKSLFLLSLILLTSSSWYYENNFWPQKAAAKEVKKPLHPLPDMAFVKGACFKMGNFFETGNSDELPFHDVCLDNFFIAKYEVTIGDFRRFVDATAYVTEVEKEGKGWILNKTGDNWEEQEGISWRNPGFDQEENHPVTMVSWNDAMAYINWLNKERGMKYRLPTEAEWEFAARDGGKFIEYSWGNEWPDGNIAGDESWNHFPKRPWPVWEDYDDSYVYTSPRGSFKPNSFGLYDMTGNVWEWCADWYKGDYYEKSPRKNPKGPVTGTHRARRGGSWFSSPKSIRTTLRDSGTPNEMDFYLGFRLARSAEAEVKNATQ